MKNIVIALLLIAAFSQSSWAGISAGYETLTILPHAFVVYANDPGSGWGLKASSDFGTSVLSGISSIMTGAFTFGIVNPRYSIVTLSVTKDLSSSANSRSYFRAGAFAVTASGGGKTQSAVVPSIGIGWDTYRFLNDALIGNMELSFPELLTFNLRYSF